MGLSCVFLLALLSLRSCLGRHLPRDDGSTLYAISERWAFHTGGYPNSPAVSQDGKTVFVGSENYNLYAIDATNGTKRWAFKTAGLVTSSPAVSQDGKTVFVGSYDNNLYAIDVTNGTKRWAFKTGNIVRSSPAVSQDGKTVFVGSDDNNLYTIDPTTGQSVGRSRPRGSSSRLLR